MSKKMHTKQITDSSVEGINQRFSLIKLDELHGNKYQMDMNFQQQIKPF